MAPRKNDADVQPILLSHFHNVIQNLFPAPLRVLRIQVVSFIDKQHAANRVFNKLLGFCSAHLLQLVAACLVESAVALAHAELNQQFASKNVVLEQEIQKMQAEVSIMESELATLRPSLLDDLQKQRSATLEKTDQTVAESKALEVQIRELEGSISQLESDNDKRGMLLRSRARKCMCVKNLF